MHSDSMDNQVKTIVSQVVKLTEAINESNKLQASVIELQQSVKGVKNEFEKKTSCIIIVMLILYINVIILLLL